MVTIALGVCQYGPNAVDNSRKHKEPLRSSQREITAGMAVPTNAAGDRWKPWDKLMRAAGCLAPPPEPAVSDCPSFPANLTSERQKQVSFLVMILPGIFSEHFCSSSPHTFLLLKLIDSSDKCSEQKPLFGWLCPKSHLDVIIIQYDSIHLVGCKIYHIVFYKYARTFF